MITYTVKLGDYKRQKGPVLACDERKTFYTSVLHTIRGGHQDYVDSQEKIDVLKTKLKPNERIEIVAHDDGIYTIRLRKEKKA